MTRAILSVSDKSGLEPFARALAGRGFELVSTGGTFAALEAAGLPVSYVQDITGFPEILGGRVKTLHPVIHGGILARRDAASLAELDEHGIRPVDLVYANLYPFRETIARTGATLEDALENIDIGGPAMLRAAAKNHPAVWTVVDPADHERVLAALDAGDDPPLRRELAAKAYAHTSAYDAAIVEYLAGVDRAPGSLPQKLDLQLERTAGLRYGENPHQAAALYRVPGARGPLLDARLLSGKPMGFNNYADADAAWALVSELEDPACVCVKHANPCGVALGAGAREAWERARDADTLSVYGGVVALNRPVDLATAQATRGTFLEVLIAPEVSPEAAAWLAERKPDLRVLEAGPAAPAGIELRPVAGGFLAQEPDSRHWTDLCPEVVTRLEPTDRQWADLELAWKVGKHARSNNVVLARDGVTVGVGSGAVSRIWAAERAILNAGDRARGAVLSSEAFFPFDDVVRAAAAAGVAAIMQPGGAKRDPEVIAAADGLGVAMAFTGSRHFRH